MGAGRPATAWPRATRVQSRGRALATACCRSPPPLATVGCALVAGRTDHGAPVTALLVLAPFALAEVFTPLPEAARRWPRARGGRPSARPPCSTSEPAVAARRVDDAAPPHDAPGDTGTGYAVPHLRLRGVSASWDGRRDRALASADLAVAPGQVVAVTGPSGCGKSTLLAVLARQLDPERAATSSTGRTRWPCRSSGSATCSPSSTTSRTSSPPRCARTCAWPGPRRRRRARRRPRRGRAAGRGSRAARRARHPAGRRRPRRSAAASAPGCRSPAPCSRGGPVLLLDEPVAHLDHPTAVAVLHDLLAAAAGAASSS